MKYTCIYIYIYIMNYTHIFCMEQMSKYPSVDVVSERRRDPRMMLTSVPAAQWGQRLARLGSPTGRGSCRKCLFIFWVRWFCVIPDFNQLKGFSFYQRTWVSMTNPKAFWTCSETVQKTSAISPDLGMVPFEFGNHDLGNPSIRTCGLIVWLWYWGVLQTIV